MAGYPPCAKCGKPWEEHYAPDQLPYKNGPYGTYGLTADHTPAIPGVHAGVTRDDAPMQRSEYRVVVYHGVGDVDPDDVSWLYDSDASVVSATRVRTDPIAGNARDEHLATEIEPLFNWRPGQGPLTHRVLAAKLDAVREALLDTAVALLSVAEQAEYDDELEVTIDDADMGLGMLREAWATAELDGDLIDLALARGGYTKERNA